MDDERIPLEDAERIAAGLVRVIEPYCLRVEIAGSIRRRRPAVKDIELVAIPRWEEIPAAAPGTLFDEPQPVRVNRLYEWATAPETTARIRWIKTGTPEVVDWQIRPDGRYWRGIVRKNGVRIDLFLAGPDNWGWILFLRTGSAKWNQAVVTHARRIGRPSDGGTLRQADGSPLPTPEEDDVFRVLGLEWAPPERRRDGADLRGCWIRASDRESADAAAERR